jgi:branched-chain amino acid transport system substrate-binding protein
MWQGACLAIEQANVAGGYKGLAFRLVAAWSENPWGSGVKDLTRLVFEDRVWAIVGGADGPTTHLAEQIAVKAGLTLLNPVSTDKTVNLTNVPWIFSFTPQDPIQARTLAVGLSSSLAGGSFVLVSAVDHDSHLFVMELQRLLTPGRPACTSQYPFNPAENDANSLAERVVRSGTESVVLVAGALPSARFTGVLRENGYKGRIFGGPQMACQTFLHAAGPAAEGVTFPCSYEPSARPTAFEEQFKRRFGESPDTLAAHTYDAVSLLVAAIRKAGLSRPRIRDAVRDLSPWPGVTGTIRWNASGANPSPVALGTIHRGRTVPLDQGP